MPPGCVERRPSGDLPHAPLVQTAFSTQSGMTSSSSPKLGARMPRSRSGLLSNQLSTCLLMTSGWILDTLVAASASTAGCGGGMSEASFRIERIVMWSFLRSTLNDSTSLLLRGSSFGPRTELWCEGGTAAAYEPVCRSRPRARRASTLACGPRRKLRTKFLHKGAARSAVVVQGVTSLRD